MFGVNLATVAALCGQAAEAADSADVAETASAGGAGWLVFLLVAAVFIVPAVLGAMIAKAIRMPDYGWKIGLCLFSVIAGAVTVGFGWPPKLGIDLRGGTILIYEIDKSQEEKLLADGPDDAAQGASGVDTDKLIAAVRRRIDPAGIKELTIRQRGPDQIEIIIPDVEDDELRVIKDQISSIGALEFRITANRDDPLHRTWIALAEENPSLTSVRDDEGVEKARWVKLGPELPPDGLVTRSDPDGGLEALVMIEPPERTVTGAYLTRARSSFGEQGPEVVFTLNGRGGVLFGRFTEANLEEKRNVKERLGIVLDNILLTAPGLNDRITTQGRITGIRDQEEIKRVVGILNAGSLPTALNSTPISQQVVSPTLGRDTIQAGWRSLGVAMALVLAFMMVYYRLSGVIACCVLLLNMLLVLAMIITIKAALTLPGLAGLVLTVGMAVDANVLIFERIREELNKGAALRMAIRNGFDQATRTIIDANLTTLIVAVVLYSIGTDQIKGFAVTLFLGIVLSMFTAVFAARVIFEIAERRRWIKSLSMMKMLSNPNFDFVKYFVPATVGSLVLIAAGLVCVFSQGSSILDIDFTSGFSVHIVFDEPQQIGDVRSRIAADPDLQTATVLGFGEERKEFKVDVPTSEEIADVEAVESRLIDIFGDELKRNSLEVSNLRPVQTTSTPAVGLRSGGGAMFASMALAQTEGEESASQPTGEAENSAEESENLAEAASEAATEEEAADLEAAAAEETAVDEAATGDLEDPFADVATPSATSSTDPYAGGTQADLSFEDALNQASLSARIDEAFAATGLPEARYRLRNPELAPGSSQSFSNWTLTVALDQPRTEQLLSAVGEALSARPMFPTANSIGPSVAGDTQTQALGAMAVSLLGIVLYVWFRFQDIAWGLASVVALVHDVLFILGAVAASTFLAGALAFLLVEPFKISMTIIAAFLTIVGYSINDTIVIFDRMREVKGKSPELKGDMVNVSLNQTLARTIITSLTVFLVVLPLYVMGGQAIHGFAFSLLVGLVVGSYSSLFIAAPLVLWMIGRKRAKGA